MKHKIISIVAAAAAVLVGTAACNKVKEQAFDPNDPAVMTITVQPDSVGVKAVDGTATFTFTAPDYWFVSSPVDWLTFEPESGKAGEVTLTVKAAQNTGAVRSTLVTITSKGQRGQFKLGQDAWPYSAQDWMLSGTVKGGDLVPMTDVSDKLVWEVTGLPYNVGEVFKFRMGTSDSDILGLSGGMTPVEGKDNAYSGDLVKGGESIGLPDYGYWDITLDLNTWTFTAVLSDRFSWTYIGSVGGSNWDKDFDMEDKGNKLVWGASRVEFHDGEAIKFRMDKRDAVVLGIDGEFAPAENAENTYVAKLKENGANVSLPSEGFWDLTLDVEAKTLTAVFVEKLPIPVDVKGTLIWDEKTVFDSWSATAVVPAEKFADAQEGQLIRVYYVNKGDDFNPIFKHVEDWSDWAELQDAKVVEDEYFESPITTAVLAELKEKGLRFQGVGFTLVAVSLVNPPVSGETVIWDTETAFADWSATIAIPAENFASANEGDVIRVFISGKGGDYNPIFKHVEDWSDWTEFQSAKVDGEDYFEAPIPAGALEELKAKGLRFQGVGFTIVKVVLVQPIVLWDTETAFADWSATIVVPAESFAPASEGKIVRVLISGKGGDYNPIFKHVEDWSDWTEFQNAKVDGDDYFEAPIPAGAVDELQAKGLRFQGVGFTIVKVVLK